MEANELRVNNWYRCKIYNGNKDVIMQFTSQEYKYAHLFEPIPLTEDILLKCGFMWSIYHQAFHFGDMAMNEFYDINECYPTGYQLSTFKMKELIGGSIFYLHQLQNLYFSLTGKELEINL